MMGRTSPKTRGVPDDGRRRISEWIEAVPDRCGGRPTIKGTRLTVAHLGLWIRGRLDLRAVAEEMGVPAEALEEARRLYLSPEIPRSFWDEDQSAGCEE